MRVSTTMLPSLNVSRMRLPSASEDTNGPNRFVKRIARVGWVLRDGPFDRRTARQAEFPQVGEQGGVDLGRGLSDHVRHAA